MLTVPQHKDLLSVISAYRVLRITESCELNTLKIGLADKQTGFAGASKNCMRAISKSDSTTQDSGISLTMIQTCPHDIVFIMSQAHWYDRFKSTLIGLVLKHLTAIPRYLNLLYFFQPLHETKT